MIITRKIEIFVCEENKDLREEYFKKLYDNRKIAVKTANMAISHLFALDNTLPYLSDESRELVQFIGVKGEKGTRQNAAYVAASNMFKGQASMQMVSSVIQNVQKMYQDDRKKGGTWEKSLRSYKANMPIPYPANSFTNLRFADYTNGNDETREGCFFSLMGIPFQMRFGRDRSNNSIIVRRIVEQQLFNSSNGKEGSATQYKMCTSSISFEKKLDSKTDRNRQKIFLHLCVDIPKKEVKVNSKKTLFCYLDVNHPIKCLVNKQYSDEDSKSYKWITIGSAEEFLYRRRQIQEAVRRCQVDCQYNTGGKGRKRKLQALNRYENKEKKYVDTRLHLYSKMLVNIAVDNECGVICLLNQKARENKAKLDNAKGEPFVLRNWSYYGLKSKIQYKAKLYGITLKEQGKSDNDDENLDGYDD